MNKSTSNFFQRRIIQGPKVMFSVPADGAINIDPAATILIQFNKPVQLANFAFERVSTHAMMGKSTTHPGGDQTKVLITPTALMLAGEAYRVYERIGFPIIDYVNKERYPTAAPFPITITITP